ncbi:MAG: flagellar motor protein [Bryobacterales bacterium]|nr:flagellar motor protein [Bryobacterales bacterium]
MDLGTTGGLLLAVGGILGGYYLEHGRAGDLMGASAALIVLGGSLGATLVANPLSLVRRAVRLTGSLLREPADDSAALLETIVDFATRARKAGIVALEQEAMEVEDAFLRKSLTLAVDGVDLQEIRSSMELDMDVVERRWEDAAKVYESAGGFAPTIGIIGAVLGLITVMGDLSDISKVGKGIAAAFVATIYGVGSANLLFLPAGHKLRLRAAAARERQELILEGVCSIAEGLNPKMIRSKLEAYLPARPGPVEKRTSGAAGARRAA